MHHLLLAVRSIVLPAKEPTSEWMLQVVQDELAGSSDSLALLNILFPGVERFGHNCEVGILKEEPNDAFLHVVLLHSHLLLDVLLNGLGRIAGVDEVLLHGSCVAHVLVSSHHDLAFGLNKIHRRIRLR